MVPCVLRRFWRAPSGERCVRTSGPACVRTADCRLGAQPVRDHRSAIDGVGLRRRLVTRPAGGDSWRPGGPSRRLPCVVWCDALASAGKLDASGCRRGTTCRGSAGRGVAEVPGRRLVFCRPGRTDEPDEELIGAHETDRWPRRRRSAPRRPIIFCMDARILSRGRSGLADARVSPKCAPEPAQCHLRAL